MRFEMVTTGRLWLCNIIDSGGFVFRAVRRYKHTYNVILDLDGMAATSKHWRSLLTYSRQSYTFLTRTNIKQRNDWNNSDRIL